MSEKIGKGAKEIAVKQASVSLRVGLVYMGLAGLCFFLFRDSLMAFWSGKTVSGRERALEPIEDVRRADRSGLG